LDLQFSVEHKTAHSDLDNIKFENSGQEMNYLALKLRGIRCHAGPDKPAPAFSKPGASSLDFWIPTFIRLWRICRDDDSPQADGVLNKSF